MRRVPKVVRCCPVFLKVWRYRTRAGKKMGWSQLKDIWKCPDCGTWSAYKSTFIDFVCPKRERRKTADRRKVNARTK